MQDIQGGNFDTKSGARVTLEGRSLQMRLIRNRSKTYDKSRIKISQKFLIKFLITNSMI